MSDELLKECDHIFVADDWETTFNSEDISELSEAAGLYDGFAGRIVPVGRLKRMSTVYAVNIATDWDDDGEPSDWEVTVFDTKEKAEAAHKASLTRPQKAA